MRETPDIGFAIGLGHFLGGLIGIVFAPWVAVVSGAITMAVAVYFATRNNPA